MKRISAKNLEVLKTTARNLTDASKEVTIIAPLEGRGLVIEVYDIMSGKGRGFHPFSYDCALGYLSGVNMMFNGL